MEGDTYLKWKGWAPENFGVLPVGSLQYFNQIFHGTLLPGQAALEIGFGNGALLTYLRNRQLSVVGIEASQQLVGLAVKSGYEAYLGAPQNIEAISGRKFDLIVAIDVVEHLTQDQLRALCEWAGEHLVANGRMILRFPEGASPLSMANQNGDFTHISYLTRTKLESMAIATGLRLTAYREDILSSTSLCSRGLAGRIVLYLLQLYARLVSCAVRLLLAPYNSSIRLAPNSLAVLVPAADCCHQVDSPGHDGCG